MTDTTVQWTDVEAIVTSSVQPGLSQWPASLQVGDFKADIPNMDNYSTATFRA